MIFGIFANANEWEALEKRLRELAGEHLPYALAPLVMLAFLVAYILLAYREVAQRFGR